MNGNNIFNKMFNIMSADKSNVSLAKILLIFYTIMASQQNELLGKQMKGFIADNRLVQHVIAFILMIVVVNMIGGIQETDKLLFYSTIAYIWFIFSTKLDIQWNLILIMLMIVLFLYENRQNVKHSIMANDDNVTREIRKSIIDDDASWNTYIVSGLMIITLIGVYLYANKKGVQYGGERYDPIKFLLY